MERLKVVPQVGALTWLGVRPERGAPMRPSEELELVADRGIVGDRYRAGGNRQVTLIQAEHLPVIAAFTGGAVTPELVRRNLVVSGVNLLSLQKQRFAIGDVILIGTGPCAPCDKMDAALGAGGFQAMRGHGGICARIERSGVIRRGDRVRVAPR
jgi:MOSC domain-containing protein YiiM